MRTQTLESIVKWLRSRGGTVYAGEPVSQLSHAMQCATLAMRNDATSDLVTAALLHDIGHLSDNADERLQPHDRLAAALLEGLFPPPVVEPIRLHVSAKRYLCAVEPAYWNGLSAMSRQSLEWQGGPFSVEECAGFIAQPFAEDAIRLRRWDDAAKVPQAPTFPLDYFLTIMWSQASELPDKA